VAYEDVMSNSLPKSFNGPVGIIGFGAFGQLVAQHLRDHFQVLVSDIAPDLATAKTLDVAVAPFETVAKCPVVIIAVPVCAMRSVATALAPLLKVGTLVLDVGSVKVEPAAIMAQLLPPTVDIVATHPLFGPKSAGDGLRGLQIAICPIRGPRLRAAAFCRKAGLEVIMTTPEDHDREIAQVQGLTHLVANLLVKMDIRETRMTTRSFQALMSAVDMVRHDAPDVLQAILRVNPHAGDIIKRFKSLTSALEDPA
jgi:prephenate dehydrogenase